MRNVLKNMRQPAVLAILFSGCSVLSFAQSTAFTGFSSGNLVLTRTVYAGTACTVVVGQACPPVCPATAACGAAVAADNGTLPVPAHLIVTSFSSKSEMAINLSSDGTALTMVGY